MLQIFIPTKIKGYSDLNLPSNKFKEILNNSFDLKLEKFESSFFEGYYFNSKNNNKDLVSLCNGEFGEFYFLDYDFFKQELYSKGTRIIKPDEISIKIDKVMEDVSLIIFDLKSDKLLTNTRKDDLINRVFRSMFILSGIVFLLHSLKNKSIENKQDLEDYDGLAEYEGQASLLSETSKNKILELDLAISKLEGQVEMFIGVVGKIA